jgi:DNA-binding transcriptional LysR family regulator
MPKYRIQTVPFSEHPAVNTTQDLNWEDIRVFLFVARNQSFRTAAEELGLSFNTVRRRIERLEHMTKMLLLARHPQGIELTRDGQSLLDKARAMESAAFGVARFGRSSPVVSGLVRISVTEGLGTFWIVPRLLRFQQAHPNVVLELNCTFRAPDLSRMEADISIQLKPPKHADVKAVRLGHMHVMPFASPDYLRTYGTPKTLKDVEQHRIVEQLSPQLDIDAVGRLFPDKAREGFVAIAANTSTAHFWAVVRGAGLGMLPTYLAALGARIRPVDLDLHVKHEIWLTYHADGKRLRRVSLAIDWIRANFDPARFPWFGEKFVHPTDLEKLGQSVAAENHFSNLVGT